MSTKYGVELTLGRGLTVLIHAVREAAHSQFGCVGGRHLPVRIPLTPFFDIPERDVPGLEDSIYRTLSDMPPKSMDFWMSRTGASLDEDTGSVALNFELYGESIFSILQKPKRNRRSFFGFGGGDVSEERETSPPHPVYAFQENLWRAVSRTSGVRTADPGFTFVPRVPVLERSGLTGQNLVEAAELVGSGVNAFDAETVTVPRSVWLVRYTSEKAGDDWSDGSWREDVSWRRLRSYHINPAPPPSA